VKGRPHLRPSTIDVVVIGGGVVGAATARAVAGRGASVAVLDEGSLVTAQGSSRGTARIIAPAPYPDAEYLEMGLRALERWRELERSSGASFLIMRGALYAGSEIERFASAWESAGVEIVRLTAGEVQQRWGITGLGPEPILFQPDAGVIRADRARDALLESAVERGTKMHQHELVIAIEPAEETARLHTTRRTWNAGRVIVVAGPWTKELVVPLGIDLPVTVTSQSVAYFSPPPNADELPAVMGFDGDEPYALIDPVRGLKAALHRGGPEVSPAGRWEIADAEGLKEISGWVRSRFGAVGEPIDAEACLYTSTADERFILERHGPIVVGSACSGQGFGFAPETGESLADLALQPAPLASDAA
jgi:sarcosine oxidase